MMLALGDAMAVALLRRRGFSPSDFQLLHPGGTLGHRLKRVRQIMHVADRLPLVEPDAPMSEAIVVMSACSFGCVGVVGPDGVRAGVLTDGDPRRQLTPHPLARPAAQLMNPRPQPTRPQ